MTASASAGPESHGPGVEWLAARTGQDPDDLTASPAAAATSIRLAVHEVAALVARTASTRPDVRTQALREVVELRGRISAADPPAQVFGRCVAAILRDAAERLESASRLRHGS